MCVCKTFNWGFTSAVFFAVLGTIRLSDIVMNSRELPELAARLNVSVDDFNQIMNTSLNTSKVFDIFGYHLVLCT